MKADTYKCNYVEYVGSSMSAAEDLSFVGPHPLIIDGGLQQDLHDHVRKWQGGGENQPPVTYQFGNKVNYRNGLEHIVRTYADPAQCDHLLGTLQKKEPIEKNTPSHKVR